MDPITVLISAGLFVGGFIAGRLNRRRRAEPERPAPKCSCSHGINFHDGKTGKCHAGVRGPRLSNYNEEGDGTYLGERYATVTCNCRRYVGPEILPSVWAQPTELPHLNKD
jgi:hypothetical protein